jgi:hypothetical protein
VVWHLWLLMLAVLPVTSFPPIAESLGGIVLVSPLAMLPMLLILLLGVIPDFLRSGRISGLSKPLLFFALSAMLSAFGAYFLPIVPYKGQTVADRELRAGMTLIIGMGFYLSALTIPRTKEDLVASLRAIFAGLALLTIWSAIQAWTILDDQGSIPRWITTFHRLFSVRDLFPDRITGLAYEPSWLGDQLVILYLPLLISGVTVGVSVFRKPARWMTIELILLLTSLAILVMTKSRIGLLSLGAMLGLLLIIPGYRMIRGRLKILGRFPRIPEWLTSGFSLLLLLLICAVLVLGALWGMTKLDRRLAGLFEIGARVTELRYFYPQDVLFALGAKLTLAERFIYWTTAYRIFGSYPVLGVGPGNAGFLFERFMPIYGYQLVEIQNVLTEPIYGFPNPKSLWFRILAEQGIIGMITFVIWLFVLGLSARSLLQSRDRFDRFIGLAGLLCLAAQLFEGFSLDTYALPQLWIMLGLLSAWANRRLLGSLSPQAGKPEGELPLAARADS